MIIFPITFYAVKPYIRNTVVNLGIDDSLEEKAAGSYWTSDSYVI
jgi:hypothetical protein